MFLLDENKELLWKLFGNRRRNLNPAYRICESSFEERSGYARQIEAASERERERERDRERERSAMGRLSLALWFTRQPHGSLDYAPPISRVLSAGTTS